MTNKYPLYHIDEIHMPFIQGSFRCKTGEMVSGLFLLDSGSTDNILNLAVLELLADDAVSADKKNVSALGNMGENCTLIQLEMNVCDLNCETTFCLAQRIDFESCFGKNRIIGILGVSFLLAHQLVLDFNCKCVYQDEERLFRLDDKSFFFPMGLGLNHYNLPVVGIVKDEREYIFIPDSGCNISMITQSALEKGTENIRYQKEYCDVTGIFGNVTTKLAQADFDMLSIGKQEGQTELQTNTEHFQVLQDKEYLFEIDKPGVPSISGLLSTDYMLRHHWILDFHKEIIYSLAH